MEPQSLRHNLLFLLVAVALSAVIAGGVVFTIGKIQNTNTKNDLQAQVDTLKKEIAAIPSASASPTPTTATTPTPTATLDPSKATYTNTKYGYSFTYPKADLAITEVDVASAVAISPTADSVGILPAGATMSMSHSAEIFETLLESNVQFSKSGIESFLNKPSGAGGAPSTYTVTSTKLNNIDAFKVDGDPFAHVQYYIQTKSGVVILVMASSDNADALVSINSLSLSN